MIGPGTLILRADAGTAMGTGHVMRSLALAEAWRSAGGRSVMLGHCGAALAARIQAHGFEHVTLQRPETTAEELAARLRPMAEHARGDRTWVALDGYTFEGACQAVVRQLGMRLLVIDDLAHLDRYQADVLVNGNLGAETRDYAYDEGGLLLLGPGFALLRPEFRDAPAERVVPKAVRKVLVVLGGSDPGNVTGVVIDGLGRLADLGLEARVVVGPANPHLETLRAQATRSATRVELLANPPDMPRLMAEADLAISAAGTTCWELARMGLPALLVVVADNQEHIAGAVERAELAESLGRAERLTPEGVAGAMRRLCADAERRRSYAARGPRVIDARGADRVVAVMRALDGELPAEEVTLRFARPDDLVPLWRLSNEPSVRRSSMCSERITLEEHTEWFTERLLSPGVRMWVLDFHGVVLGHVRYVYETPRMAEISLAVAPAFRRRGLALRLITQTREDACAELRAEQVRAIVRVENEASAAAFRRAGYRYAETRLVRGQKCRIFHTGGS